MYVGVLEVKVKVIDAITLKDKRQVLKSVFDRVRNKFDFSPGEVGEQEMINLSIWGFSCVSNSYSFTEQRLNSLLNFLENDYRFEIIEIRRDIY